MNRKDLYQELVSSARNAYNATSCASSTPSLSWYDEGRDNICREINLWTYWQGFGYAKNHPDIDYLLVGQDWGNPSADKNKGLMDRIAAMNHGETNVNYINTDNTHPYQTDMNMAELFKVLGFGNDNESIVNKRYTNLFFTNFCLGYRIAWKSESGSMTKALMNKDKDYFIRLCNILNPKRIICLGKLTFECVYEALSGEKALSIPGYRGDYNTFLETQNGFDVDNGEIVTKIFPVAHCGTFGTMNRNKVLKAGKRVTNPALPKDDPLFLQKKDWEKAII